MTHGPCLYEKAYICQRLSSLFSLLSSLYHEVQSATYPFGCRLPTRRTSQNSNQLDELKKPKVITLEKPPIKFSFKPATFDPPHSIPYISKDFLLGFGKFIGRNLFDLRIKPSIFSYQPSSSFSSSSNPFLVESFCVVGEDATATRTDVATIA